MLAKRHFFLPVSEEEKIQKKKSWALQIPAVISGSLVRLGYGTVNYWTSTAIPYLFSNEARFKVTQDEASWIISLGMFGAVVGLLLYPLFINRIGRKHTMLLFAIPQVFSWILIYYAANVYHLYFSRILSGIGYNVGFIVEVIYIGEIAQKNLRGTLITTGKLNYYLGSLLVLILGAFVSYDNMNLILLLVSLLFILIFPFMPESPYFYLMINREEDAFQSMVKLRGNRDIKALQSEIDVMREGMRRESTKEYLLKKLFGMRKNRRAFAIALLAFMSVVLSGCTTMAGNLQTIVGYTDTSLKPEYTTILIVSVMLVITVLFGPLPDYLGRRIMILCFGILTALSSATVGVFFLCKYHLEIDNLSSISWIPLVALIVYLVASNTGLYNLFNILMSELFSLEVKGSVTAIVNIIGDSLEFLLKLGFLRSIEIFGIYGIFWIFGACSFVSTLTTFIIMPETKGKTLEEIQEILE